MGSGSTGQGALLNTPEGPAPRLAELKVIGAGKTSFLRGEKGLGEERRAGKLTKEYESVLRRYDVRFHGAGPMVRDSQSRRQAP